MRRAPLAAPERRLRHCHLPTAARPALVVLLAALALVACVSRSMPQRTLRAGYATPLVDVVASTGAGAARDTLLGDSLRYRYADSVVEIRTAMLADRVALSITNRTDAPLTLVWEEARYTDFDGGTTTVSRAEGRRGRKRGEAPTVIAPRGTFVGALLPDNRAVHQPGHAGWYDWKPATGNPPLLTVRSATVTGLPGEPDAERQRAAFLAEVREMMGKRVGVMIPLRAGEMARDYTLWFAVRGATVVE